MNVRIWTGAAGIAAAIVTGLLLATPARAQSIDRERCESLLHADLTAEPEAPTRIMAAALRSGDGGTPRCLVEGYVAPEVGFELVLPADRWNGKFVHIGCSGLCGTHSWQSMRTWCADALRRGYACIGTDQGHAVRGVGGDSLWALNNLQAEVDFGFRAVHVATVAGKAIARHVYGDEPRYAYFLGCSNAGRQALIEAQAFPTDFDGIVAMDPSNLMLTNVSLLWNQLMTENAAGSPLFARTDLELLHRLVLDRCDDHDGVRDGIIGNPRACRRRFDPTELQCSRDGQRDCLTPQQVEAARKVYAGPTTSAGERIFFGSMPGTELRGMFSTSAGMARGNANLFRYMFFLPDAGPSWDLRSFDFDRDVSRLDIMGVIYGSTNPDLRRFRQRNGKLIIVQGWDDSGSPLPLSSIDYYETVTRTMGGAGPTREFARLFMIPGREHCGFGPGATAIDFLDAIEQWVERGRAPDLLIGAHVTSDDEADQIRTPRSRDIVTFTRPHYAYPLAARYSGRGDPDDHRSFVPVPLD